MNKLSRASPIVISLILSLAPLLHASAQGSASPASLDSCGSYYRDGDYQKALDCLTGLSNTLMTHDDSLAALKYMAFSSGMLSMIDRSKGYFKSALALDPAMEIDTLEWPPNIAIIFNQVKLEAAMAKIKSPASAGNDGTLHQRHSALPVVYMATAVGSAGAAGYLLFLGRTFRQKYSDVGPQDPDPQGSLDRYYRNYMIAYGACAACATVSAVSIYLFVKKNRAQKRVLKVAIGPAKAALVYSF
jgi:hypothetical protein